MTEALFAMPVHLRRRLVEALGSGILPPACTSSSVRSVLGIRDGADGIAEAVSSLASRGFDGATCAEWIRSVDAAAARTPRPDLVWSGPEVTGVHARNTRHVYEELIGGAERSLWISTYVYFDGPKAFELLAKRMDAVPELSVTLLLNIQRGRADTTKSDDLIRRFADRLWKTDWPGTRRPRVYYDPRALEPEGPGGVLHAKAVIADDEAVFITSANLTEAALDRNIEIGLLTRDKALAVSVVSHFRVLIEQAMLGVLPWS